MNHPTLLPTSRQGESFAGVTYHLDGELVPALTVELSAGTTVYFEHHTLLWKHVGIEIGIKSMAGAFRRMIAGMQIFMTEARGNGQIAFSRDGAGHIFPIHLKQGEELHVREHQFLAATGNVGFDFQFINSISSALFGGTGFFMDRFHGAAGEGILWLHGYGNVFEIVLGPGEQIDVEPGAWLYKDPSVALSTTLVGLSTGFFGGNSFTMNRFTGPGKLGIQSMATPALMDHTASGESVRTQSGFGLLALILQAMGRRD